MHKTTFGKNRRKSSSKKSTSQKKDRERHIENMQHYLVKNLNVHRLIGFNFWSGLQKVILSNLLLKGEPTARLDHSLIFFFLQ